MKLTKSPKSEVPVLSSTRCLRYCRGILAKLAQSRWNLTREFRETVSAHQHLARLTLNEAEALAWETGFPHLFFPALAEEKLRAVSQWISRNQAFGRTRFRGEFVHTHTSR